MQRTKIKELYAMPFDYLAKKLTVCGWIKTNRSQSQFGFLNINDGSHLNNLQVVYENTLPSFQDISKFNVGSSVIVEGSLRITPDRPQPFELKASSITLAGASCESFPIQPKRHTREFLREVAHLRPRTSLFSAVFRIRSVAAMAIHTYFQNNGYVYVNTPIITCSDCEGSEQMFKITTLDFDNLPKKDAGKIDFSEDLFGKEAFITGSGQLHGETFAMAFGNIYTFGPTFRTENSNTKTHANEFWMIEPEMAFCDLNEMMDIEEEMLKYVIGFVLERCPYEINYLDKYVEKDLREKLEKIIHSSFKRITHRDAIDLLNKAKVKWVYKPSYNGDIAKEHEKYLTDYFASPVFVTSWPKNIKAYYMKLNPDNETVAAADLLVPGAGELIGGSQREENLEKLTQRMDELHIDKKGMEWYLDTRRYGGCVHSGFGLGFERLIMYLTGIENIRDVIPYPRTPKNCDF